MRNALFFAACLPVCAAAQPYAIGNLALTVYDAGRDRDIGCEVHYPATVAGDATPLIDGQFPVILIGHGFVMGTDAYTYLWQHYAPLGYIVVLPTTEAGFAPAHAEFGADLAFLAADLQAANDSVASPFYQHVLPKAVLMGHSMGGGAAFLGAAGNAAITALVTLAPAETNPSAVAAAATVQVPTLVFAGSEDCVTPIPDHQGPMYDALSIPCKAFVNITGGGHCYFGDDSFTCSFGELTCGPDLTITREEQHDVVTDITDLWLSLHVQEDVSALSPLLDSLSTSGRFTAQTTCLSTGVAASFASTDQLLVSLSAGQALVQGARAGERFVLRDITARVLWTGVANGTTITLPMPCSNSMFLIEAQRAEHTRVVRVFPVL